jgi:alpha-galactosidase
MGVWSQPQQHDTPDATSCNLVNAMLGRIHQSGFLPVLSPESFAQVRNGISVYKQEIRSHIPTLTPFYPLGMPDVMAPIQPAALLMRGACAFLYGGLEKRRRETSTCHGASATLACCIR